MFLISNKRNLVKTFQFKNKTFPFEKVLPKNKLTHASSFCFDMFYNIPCADIAL